MYPSTLVFSGLGKGVAVEGALLLISLFGLGCNSVGIGAASSAGRSGRSLDTYGTHYETENGSSSCGCN